MKFNYKMQILLLCSRIDWNSVISVFETEMQKRKSSKTWKVYIKEESDELTLERLKDIRSYAKLI